MNRLSGKVALITGGARGIGRATVELFAKQGALVIAADLEEPVHPFGHASVQFIRIDVRDEADWKSAVATIIDRRGRLDVLVNNAAIAGSFASITAETLDNWLDVIAVNLTGTMLGMREVIPHMQAGKSGSIINFSSIWGVAAVENGVAYHATKGAVRSLTKNAAITYAADGIRVNSVHPGIVATPPTLREGAKALSDSVVAATPLGRMAQPGEIANGCLFLASDESSFMTGAELVIDGGYLAK